MTFNTDTDNLPAAAEIADLQERVLAACLHMLDSGLITGTWGMACARTESGHVVVTPSGMNYRTLKPADLPVVDSGGRRILGTLRPSTETPMFTRLFALRPDIRAIAHTHSTSATGFACAGRSIPAVLAELAEAVGGPVPCAEYGRFGTPELADRIVEVAANVRAVLLRNHGVVTFGSSVEEASSAALVVEEAARVALVFDQLGGSGGIPQEEINALRQIHLQRYGQH
jgi:L-ribulose-5-phosphate 4-epimerase